MAKAVSYHCIVSCHYGMGGKGPLITDHAPETETETETKLRLRGCLPPPRAALQGKTGFYVLRTCLSSVELCCGVERHCLCLALLLPFRQKLMSMPAVLSSRAGRAGRVGSGQRRGQASPAAGRPAQGHGRRRAYRCNRVREHSRLIGLPCLFL